MRRAIALAEEGKLGLDDNINKYVDFFPDKKITVKNLLLHESGIPRFESNGEKTSLHDLLESLRDKPFLFEPDLGQEYSNEGYSLLAYIVEKVSRISYSTFLKGKFFEPLQMKNSGVLPYSSPELVSGHRLTPSGPILISAENYNFAIGSGSNYSDINDLLTWARAIANNKVISLNEFEIKEEEERETVHQSGLMQGYTAYASIYPKDHLYILFLSNISSGFHNTPTTFIYSP